MSRAVMFPLTEMQDLARETPAVPTGVRDGLLLMTYYGAPAWFPLPGQGLLSQDFGVRVDRKPLAVVQRRLIHPVKINNARIPSNTNVG